MMRGPGALFGGIRAAGVVLVAPLLSGCDAEPHPRQSLGTPLTCGALPTSPWRPEDPSVMWVAPSVEISGSDGVVSTDSAIFVYLRRVGAVQILNLDGTFRTEFGRAGRGPGELAGQRFTRLRPRSVSSWMAFSDSLAVLDGERVTFFDVDGTALTATPSLGPLAREALAFVRRLTMSGDTLFLDVESRPFDNPARRTLTVWQLGPDSPAPVLRRVLPDLPRDANGVPFQGAHEAQPVWDLHRSCIVVSNGYSPFLWVYDRSGTLLDSVTVGLRALQDSDRADEDSLLRALGAGPGVRPAHVATIVDLIVDPGGWVWIRGSRENRRVADGMEEVTLIDLRTRQSILDTVPGFPIAFGSPGAYFTIVLDSTGTPRLAKVSVR